MSFVNLYQPPAAKPAAARAAGPPILETARVRLAPFTSDHAAAYIECLRSHPDAHLLRNMMWSVDTQAELEAIVAARPHWVLWAIIDKTTPDAARPAQGGSVAGIIGIEPEPAEHLSGELGPVIVLPRFQRTHVTSNAVGAVMRYCLAPPAATPPGLGYRRLFWIANALNAASLRAAERMGFTHEAVLRWAWITPAGKQGKTRPGDARPGRDNVWLSVCWDDWEGGVREHVDRAIDRL